MSKNLKENIFIERGFNISRQVFTPATRRKDLQQARVIRERRKTEENKNMSIKDLLNARLKEAQPQRDTVIKDSVITTKPDSVAVNAPAIDSTAAPADSAGRAVTDSSIVHQVAPKDSTVTKAKQNVVNTDNYVFEDEVVKQNQPSESFLTRYMKAREKSRITGPYPYV